MFLFTFTYTMRSCHNVCTRPRQFEIVVQKKLKARSIDCWSRQVFKEPDQIAFFLLTSFSKMLQVKDSKGRPNLPSIKVLRYFVQGYKSTSFIQSPRHHCIIFMLSCSWIKSGTGKLSYKGNRQTNCLVIISDNS